MLEESVTGVYAHKVSLWAISVCITLDVDVNPTLFNESEWLQANRCVVRLSSSHCKMLWEETCPRINMSEMLQLIV